MPDQTRRDIDEWHLGIEAAEVRHAELAAQPPAPLQPQISPPETPSLSAQRLDTPLHVITVEHLSWATIALYALLTRLGALGMRPLSLIEADRALLAREVADHGLRFLSIGPQAGGWLDVLRAGIFLAFGASDFGARIVAAIFGLALIAATFAMRRQIGRAGALAFATMLTASPTLTYFSRAASPTIPAITLVVIMLALLFALVGSGGTLKVAGVAIAIAAALSAEPIVFPLAAIFVAILIVMGIGELIFRRHPMIRFRVWWERRSAQMIFCAAIAIGLFAALESGVGRHNPLLAIVYGAAQQWWPILHPDPRSGLAFYSPAIAFYEFGIAIFGALGALAFVLFLLRSRIAVVAFLWTIFSAAFFLADPVHQHDWMAMILVPAALMGAILIDLIHHTSAWRWFRYPVSILLLLTIYVQLAINFVRIAPDPSEASWSHHLLLFWTEPTTTMIAEEEFAHAERAVTDRGTVFLGEESPVARWYLRDLKRAEASTDADLIVSPAAAEKPSDVRESYDFALDEKWHPGLASLGGREAMRYFFMQRTAADIFATDVRVDVRSRPPDGAAASPVASPVPSESPTAEPSITPSPTASIAPTPESSATPTAQPSESPTPVPSPAATPVASPAPTSAP